MKPFSKTTIVSVILVLVILVVTIVFVSKRKSNLHTAELQPSTDTTKVESKNNLIDQINHDETALVLSKLDNKDGLSLDDKMILISTVKDEMGFTHKSYQHFYKGVRVKGSQYMIDERDGKITSTGGEIIRLPEINVNPTLSQKVAFKKAKELIGAEKYVWDRDSSKLPKAELVLAPLDGNYKSNQFVLSWFLQINSSKPFKSIDIYIDAHTGKEVFRISNIQDIDNVGTAKTLYNYSAVPITTDYFQNGKLWQYRLRESNRNIKTCDGLGVSKSVFNQSMAADFVNEDNSWNDELLFPSTIKKAACQLHWGFEKIYDYFLKKGLRSFNGNGALISGYLNIDYKEGDIFDYKNMNAEWTGKFNNFFVFYNGGWFNNYVVGLDVVGHEFTHAIIDYHGGLDYLNETGALNESFADIFGTVIEFDTKSNPNWTINEDSKIMRSMSNPNLYNQPKTYNDKKFWHDISNRDDNGGVHTNSGVQNFWFYLLCAGGTGINDLNKSYSVSTIGMDKASAICLQTILYHCNIIKDYNSSRIATLIAATEKNYGANSAEYNSINNAWYAVGVGPQPPVIVSASDGTYADKIRVSWESKPGMYYQVYRSTIDNSASAVAVSSWLVSGINFDDTSAISGTNYYYWVKAADNSTGRYPSIISISDKGNKLRIICSAASNLSASNITTSSARINFALPGSLSSASLEYRNSNTTVWSTKTIATTASYNDLTGLNASTKYYVRIKTVCTNGASNYSSEYSFTTLAVPTCSAASNLSASNISTSGARINFVLPGNATSANIEYKITTNSTWLSVGVPLGYSYKDLTGLIKITTYNYRIKTVCSNGLISYTSTLSFTTIGTKSANINDPTFQKIPRTDFEVICYPNPAKDRIFIKISGDENQISECKFANMHGQQIFSRKFPCNSIQEVDVNQFPRGFYFLTITILNDKKTIKIVLN